MTVREASVVDFVKDLLTREGALVEKAPGDALFAVLPPPLRTALDMAESVSLRLFGETGEGEVGFPLESAGLQWCVDRAAARGRLVAVRLPALGAGIKPLSTAQECFTALNGTVHAVDARMAELEVWLLEFRYEAHSEERAEGSVFVALEPGRGALSIPLADALLASLTRAQAVSLPERPIDFAALARRVEPSVRAEILRRLGPFREGRVRRLETDRARLLAYHDTLVDEAARRRTSDAHPGDEALRAKVDAIVRQRDVKLVELAERHSVRVRYVLSSALLARYEASVCELVLKRRRREIRVDLVWDPHLHGPLPLACDGCGMPSLSFHVCDEHGHMTCADCAARCPTCGRTTCRVCHGPGCRMCARDEA